MENGPFADAFPIEKGDIPASYVSLPEGIKLEHPWVPQEGRLIELFFWGGGKERNTHFKP